MSNKELALATYKALQERKRAKAKKAESDYISYARNRDSRVKKAYNR